MVPQIRLKIKDVFSITGRGVIWTLSLDENGLKFEDIKLGDIVCKDDDATASSYRIRGIECARGLHGPMDNIGLNVVKA